MIRRAFGPGGLLVLMLAVPGTASASDFEVSSYAIVGMDYRNEFYDRAGEDTETVPVLRRIKADFRYDPDGPWQVRVGGNYGAVYFDDETDERAGFNDAYVRYQWPGRVRLQLGRMREPFGFERLTGFSRIAGTERSLVSNALAPGRSLGLKYSNYSRHDTRAIGVFREDENPGAPLALTARYTWAPIIDDNTLHFGVSGSWRYLRGEEFQIRDRAEVFRGATISRSAIFLADQSQQLGLDMLWQSAGSLTLVTELIAQRVERDDGLAWNYSGGYAQASYLVTGEQRNYRRGSLREVRPASSRGAWELVGRFSYLNLRDHSVGSRTGVGVAGVNYYLNRDVSFKLHYLRSEITGNTLHDETLGNALIFRTQFTIL